MTPKEKAIEIYDKFHVWDTMNHKEVKTLALIAISELINELEGTNSTKEGCFFWEEVKQEIEKL